MGKKTHYLKVNNICNNNCTYCNSFNKKTKINKSTDEIKKEILDAKNNDFQIIRFPCNFDSRKDFFKIIAFTKSLNLKIILETNGRVFSNIKFCKLSEKYLDEATVFVADFMDCYTFSPEKHNQTTKINDGLKQTIKGINNLKKTSIFTKIKIVKVINNVVTTEKINKNHYHSIISQNKKRKIVLMGNLGLGGCSLYLVNIIKHLSEYFEFSVIIHKDYIHKSYLPIFEKNNIEISTLDNLKKNKQFLNQADLIYMLGAATMMRYFERYDKEILKILKQKENKLLLINDPEAKILLDKTKDKLDDYFDNFSFTCNHFYEIDKKNLDSKNKLKDWVLYHPVFENNIEINEIQNDELVIGRLSRDVDYKFSEDTLKLYSLLDKPNRKFIFLGGKKSILKFLDGKPVPNNWTLYEEGEISIEDFFNKIDIFVYKTASTYKEYFGNIIPEAMHFGKPIITENRDAYPEQIEHNKTGFLCNNNQDFVNYLNQLEDKKLRKIMSENAKEYVDNKFSKENFIIDHFMVFYDIIDSFNLNSFKNDESLIRSFSKRMNLSEKNKNKKTIAFFRRRFSDENESYIFNEIKSLNKKYNVIVLTYTIKNHNKILANNIPTFLVPNTSNENWYENTKRILIENNVDLLHFETGTESENYAPLCKDIDIPFLVSFKGHDAYARPKQIGENCYSALEDNNAFVIAPSRHMSDHLESLGISSNRIIYHTFGTDVEKFHYKEKNKKEKIKFLFTGRIIGLKGLEYSILAFARIKRIFQDTEFHIVGFGDRKNYLKKLIKSLNVKDIYFSKDIVSHETIKKYLHNSDIFLHTSVVDEDNRNEGVPNSLIEAMSTGMPVITTYHGGNSELVIDGYNGLVVKEKDSEAIYQKMKYIITNPNKWNEFGKNARNTILKRHNLENQTKKLNKIYDELISTKKYNNIKLKELVIKPTLACTADCKTCSYRRSLHKDLINQKSLSLNEWKKIMSDANILGVKRFSISGGEPTLYPHLIEIIKYAKTLNWPVSLNTNGSTLTEEFAEKLIDSGVDSFMISLYSQSPEIHDEIKNCPGLWDKATNGLKILSKLKLKYPHINIRTQTLISKYNYFELDKIIKLHYELGSQEIAISYLEGDFDKKHLPSKENIEEIKEKIIPQILIDFKNKLSRDDYGVFKAKISSLYNNSNLTDEDYSLGIYNGDNCSIPDKFTILLANGDVHPCNVVEYSHEPVVGNLFDDNLYNIWFGKKWNNVRQNKTKYCKFCPINNHIRIPLEHKPTSIKKKPKILLVADYKGWAYDYKAKNIMKNLSHKYDFEIKYTEEKNNSNLINYFDGVYVFYWGHKYLEKWIPNNNKIGSGMTCEFPFYENKLNEFEIIERTSKFKIFTGNSIRICKMMEKYVPNIIYTPNGVDTDLFKPKNSKKDNKFRIGWVGNKSISTKHYDDIIIPIITKLKEKYNNIEFITATKENYITYEKMPEFYNNLDCLIVASEMDGTPNPALEAASCGITIISNHIGNMPELIKNEYNGFLVDLNVNNYVEKISFLIEKRDVCNKMGVRIRKEIELNWNWKKQSKNYDLVFQKLISD
jgi:colanic acid/amylovoran biosynthesis glycosyltransferase